MADGNRMGRHRFADRLHRPFAFALLSLLAGGGCETAPVREEAPSRPPAARAGESVPEGPAERVVLITIDTLRADYVGSYGSSRARTRTLDGLAKAGVRFETAISPAPVTLPSHVSLLTGLDPPLHGVHHNANFRLDDDIPTLAEQFRAAGFATAAFVGAVVLDRRYGLDRGFDVYGDDMGFRRTVRGIHSYAERTANAVMDAALEWLKGAPDRFFLWVHLYDPHATYDPPRGFAAKPSGPPPAVETVGLLRAAMAVLPARYAGEIYYADTELGRLVGTVNQRWSDGRTLFIATSDHGESLGEHGELTHSLTVYDATQRIPLLMAGPGIPRNSVVSTPVRLVDVAPTLLTLAGLPPLAHSSGVDLGPWIRGERDAPLDAYLEVMATQLDYGWSPVFGMRTSRYKYLRSPRIELYDLLEDPRERRNLAAERADVVAELDATLEERLEGARPVLPEKPPPPEQRALLEQLGYVVSDPPGPQPPLGWIGGPDPKDRIYAILRMVEADYYLSSDRGEQAQALLESAPDAKGWVALARAEVALELGDMERAEVEARRMVAAQPSYAEGFLVLGRILEEAGRLDEASDAYQEAARLDPTKSLSLVGLGRIAELEGDQEAAAAHYRRAMAGRAPSLAACLRLAALRFDQGRSDQAREILADLGDAAGAPSEAVIRLVRAEARAGLHEEAVTRLERSLREDRRNPELNELYEELTGGSPRGNSR